MIIPINWLNYYVTIYRYMKMTYHNHDMEDYIDYHDIRYILHITIYNTITLGTYERAISLLIQGVRII